MHFSGKRNIEQIVSTPATTELQLTQQGWSILLLWFAIHQQKPPVLLCTFETFSQTFAVSFLYFATFPPAQEHQSLSSPALRTKRHVCRDDVKWGRCAVSVTCCTHIPWAIPARIATFVWDIPVLGLAGRSGWGQEGTESWCSLSQLPRESGTADPCSPHKTFHNIKCLNHKRVINRAVDVQTHSSLCHFHLKQDFVSLELESYYHLFIF